MNQAEKIMNSNQEIVTAKCPVCSYSVAAPFFAGGYQPLATLGWPESKSDATAMPRFPHDFVLCPRCCHVWNRSFSYDAIPYFDNPNKMFNKGAIWQGHLASTRDLLLSKLPAVPTILDVGCGEGHFVRGLSHACSGKGRFVGFDPSSASVTGSGLEFHSRYFAPLQDMPVFTPDAVVIRHVLEHLTEPAAMLHQLAWGAATLEKPTWLFAEVPCIDRVLATGRLADFFYEHLSHFSTESFQTLMQQAGQIIKLAHGYDGEVVYALVLLGVPTADSERVNSASLFAQQAVFSQATIRAQLEQLAASGKRIAIWGGTGKAAAFIHQFGADSERFPLVVDSDPDKVGSFVPGTGQEIKFRDALKITPAQIVIIPSQWRAKDIIAEMARAGICAQQVLIEHSGKLIDFMTAEHPYK